MVQQIVWCTKFLCICVSSILCIWLSKFFYGILFIPLSTSYTDQFAEVNQKNWLLRSFVFTFALLLYQKQKKLPIARIIFLTPEKICGHKYLCIKSNHLTRTRGNFHFCKIFNLGHLLKVFAGNRYHTIDLSRLVFNTCTNNWKINLRFWDHLQIYLKHFYFKISLIFAL